MKRYILILNLLIIYVSVFAQSTVKTFVFHVDLVPGTLINGVGESSFTSSMKSTLDKTINSQTVTDSMFAMINTIEEKTQMYERQIQTLLARVLNENYIDNRIQMIDDNQKWLEKYLIINPDFKDIVNDHKKYIKDRADNIKRFIEDVAKKTGNDGRLDNFERNKLNVYVISELKKLCYISEGLVRQLAVINPERPLNITIPTD